MAILVVLAETLPPNPGITRSVRLPHQPITIPTNAKRHLLAVLKIHPINLSSTTLTETAMTEIEIGQVVIEIGFAIAEIMTGKVVMLGVSKMTGTTIDSTMLSTVLLESVF